MMTSVKISIKSKILMVLSALVISAVALYIFLASKLFYEDKTLLVYELNQTNVRTLGQETETYLKRLMDQIKILALLQTQATSLGVNSLIGEDEGFFRVGLLSRLESGV